MKQYLTIFLSSGRELTLEADPEEISEAFDRELSLGKCTILEGVQGSRPAKIWVNPAYVQAAVVTLDPSVS